MPTLMLDYDLHVEEFLYLLNTPHFCCLTQMFFFFCVVFVYMTVLQDTVQHSVAI